MTITELLTILREYPAATPTNVTAVEVIDGAVVLTVTTADAEDDTPPIAKLGRPSRKKAAAK